MSDQITIFYGNCELPDEDECDHRTGGMCTSDQDECMARRPVILVRVGPATAAPPAACPVPGRCPNERNGECMSLDACVHKDLDAAPEATHEGLKTDAGKQPWYAMPLTILEPLADVFAAGERKYETFNCMKPFRDPDRRFWDAAMRHLAACQLDPLARDEETGCYHAAQVAFSILMRLHHCQGK